MGTVTYAIGMIAFGIAIIWACFLATVFIVSFFRGLKRARRARRLAIEQIARDLKWTKN